MKSKYIKELNDSGPSIVDVDLVVKDWGSWSDRFSVSQFSQYGDSIFHLYRKNSLRVSIPEEQAKQIIERVGLVQIKSSVFLKCSEWISRKEAERRKKQQEDRVDLLKKEIETRTMQIQAIEEALK